LADPYLAALPATIGLVFLALAIVERGYRSYLEAKKVDPTIKFDGAYFLNILITAGGGSGIMIILSALPTLFTSISQTDQSTVTFFSIAAQALLGYTTGYTILDKLNTRVEQSFALADANIALTTKAVDTTTEQPKT
jgi:hypothetical protein